MKLHNLPLAVVSILVSLGLWVYVRSQTTASPDETEPGTFHVEVEMRNKPVGFVLPDKPKVVLIANGLPAEVNRLSQAVAQNPAMLDVSVDLSKATVGEHHYPLVVLPPKGYEVRWTFPKEVSIKLDQHASREIPVEVRPLGLPPDGYASEHQDTDPKTVLVEGLQSDLDKIGKAYVKLDWANRKEDEAMRGTVYLANDKNEDLHENLKITPEQVTILAELIPKPSASRIVVQPQIFGQAAPGYRISKVEVEPNQVVFRGPSEVLARTYTVDTRQIDISGLRATKTFTTSVVVPEQLKQSNAERIRVTITIEALPVSTVPTTTPTTPPAGAP